MSHLPYERRQRDRLTLHCPVEVFVPAEGRLCQAMTRNISSTGVYCVSSSAFSPGERLLCDIEITPRSCSLGTDAVYLDCVLEVVRLERTDAVFGMACRILRYVLRRKPTSRHDLAVSDSAPELQLE